MRQHQAMGGWLWSFSQAIEPRGIKLMVFDERHYQPPGLSMGELNKHSPMSYMLRNYGLELYLCANQPPAVTK